mmetsp:Transcript_28062/g.32146  ORF Transcript_28062/g.32146 Transcript_28062/m.32146 type:complete len:256 (+) Transcript_28062:210-977(+)
MIQLSIMILLALLITSSSAFSRINQHPKIAITELENYKRGTRNGLNLHMTTSLSSAPQQAAELNPRGVERVSVCMGELCKCQEEGQSADDILNELLSLGLPYVVEDAPCLGACGQGAMVSIDYEDGMYDLVTGLDQTLEAIGVVETGNEIHAEIKGKDPLVKTEIVQVLNDSSDSECQDSVPKEFHSIVSDHGDTSPPRTEDDKPTSKVEPIVQQEHDAVERMRAEAINSQEERANPWLNMALYIGKKMKDKMVE